MRRNYILLLLLLLVSLLAFYFLTNKQDKTSSFDRAESNFKIEDTRGISRIILTQRNGLRSDLRRVGDHWTINGSHRARQSNVDHLLNGIQRQHLDHIPNKAATENIVSSMSANGIHVEIFGPGDEKWLDYYVGGVTQDERGTFFLKAGSAQPYCLVEPGFEGGLRARYALSPVDWRDVRFWVEDNARIDTLKVNYPKQRQHSFVMYKSGNGYAVDPMFSTTPRLTGNVGNRPQSYLTMLSQLACEDFINEATERDSVTRMVPFMEISIIYPDTMSYLRFFPAGAPSESEFSPAVSRYFVDYGGHDFMVGQHEVMKGAFRSYGYFHGE